MKLPTSLYRWISKQNHNLPVIGLITFTFPQFFVRSIYNNNLGKNLWGQKKGCVTLSFDCDYPEDVLAIPEIVKLLSNYRYKASFAAVGHWVEKYPHEHQVVIENGHELMNHTYSHPDNEILNPGRKFREISRDEKLDEIVKCHELVEKKFGYRFTGLRIPHFKNLFSEDIYDLLSEVGYTYSSSTWLTNTTTFGLPFCTENGIIEFPLSTCPKHPFTVFDTWHSLNAKRLSHRFLHRGSKSYSELFKELINIAKNTGSYINIYMDPMDIKKIPEFQEMLDILADGDLEVVTYEQYIKNNMYVVGKS